MPSLERISIRGYKSIEKLESFEIRPLNILIGANGAGKSNFLSFFSLLRAMCGFSLPNLPVSGLANYVTAFGGSETLLFNGTGQTSVLSVSLESEGHTYEFSLVPTVNQQLFLAARHDSSCFHDGIVTSRKSLISKVVEEDFYDRDSSLHKTIASWCPYHFHETHIGAALRKSADRADVAYLRPNGSNLAPFLLHLNKNEPKSYQHIVETVQLIAPYFEDFRFQYPFENQVSLAWKQRNSDYILRAHQLSDGTLRFLALTTALLQPNPPSLMLIDEPELGQHPLALALLAEMFQSASFKSQIIVATQSAALLDFFTLDNVVLVEHEKGTSVFSRLNVEEYKAWLEDYTLGELWLKNVVAAGPRYE